MKLKTQNKQDKPLEELPTTRPGDKVVRRRRKRRGTFHTISHHALKFFRRTASK